MTVMISEHQTLFPPSKDMLLSPPSNRTENQKNTPRSFVGWESAEVGGAQTRTGDGSFCYVSLPSSFVSSCQMGDASLSESPEEEDSPTPNKGSCSPLIRPPSPSSDNWHGSPRKRTQTLPTFNCPLTGMAAKAEVLNRWSRIQESSEEKCGTLSEDIFKILDLRGSGSLFGGSLIKTKEGGGTGSGSTGSQDTSGEDQAAPVASPQKGVAELLDSGSAPRTQQRNDEQQPPER